MKKVLKALLALVLVLLLIVGGYCAYVILTYHRIADNQTLDVTGTSESMSSAQVDTEYKITCYNIGFGAYLPEYTFFMDGGTESRAESEESVRYATQGAAETILAENPDFAIFEEVDTDSDRSWHVNQKEALEAALPEYASTFAVNYDSAYLFYPILKPIGKSRSGISFFSKYTTTAAQRRSLPIDKGFAKFFDLDRCYSVNEVEVENGKKLVIYAVHLSAYSSNPEVRDGQLQMLYEDMKAQYDAGNYVIAGGDFNHDLKAEGDTDLTMDWAHCIDRSTVPEGLAFAFDYLSAEEQAAFVDTTRNTDIPYTPGESYTVTIDGFLLSDNVEMLSTATVDTQFAYADHNPVEMTFRLMS